MAELSRDAFLSGRVQVWQPVLGYRAGVDPVLLAASVPAQAGQSVLELGCGVGVASLCLAARVPGLLLAGLELQPDYAVLAQRNVVEAGLEMDVFTGDLSAMPAPLRQRQFDHVIANPPYFRREASVAARDTGRETAMGEDTALPLWVAAAIRRTAPRGYVSFIHRSERLPELLAAMVAGLGSVQVLPLIPRAGRDPQLILIRGRKGGRGAFRLHSGVLMHEGAAHDGDRESYTPHIRDVLRNAAALNFPL
ncbi:tRNA1(Val) (adenine(37)-N6)-methyltransferase [Thalassovita taeanensis]|uniref:tRNA1(Val) A37 N6-methylase TrmN6 n=1 Tax=Thalassovita taeanensis TaxID=657014 RepID=A0A1H9AR68_9RHOB|nr:methyltransferase [Thalassovita taeanensis]SEP79035.1 tRNA1(Val) A37 N6-methylase TrmN6 [Thalassovita taeanensis]